MDAVSVVARLCALRQDTALLAASFSQEEAAAIAETATRNAVGGWCLQNINDLYQENKSLAQVVACLRPKVFATVSANIANEVTLRRIETLCTQQGIQVVALKGIALMTGYYAQPFLRPIGDIDVWVRPEDVYKARQILLADGARNTDADQPEVIDSHHAHLAGLTYRGQLIELHHRIYAPERNRELSRPISELAVSRGGHLMLPEAPMLYHLATHAFYSHLAKGARIGWIVDIAMLLNKADDPVALVQEAMTENEAANGDFNWAIGLAMPLLPEDKAKALADMGFSAKEITPQALEINHNFIAFKTSLVAAKLSDMLMRIKAQKGLKNKWNELRKIWRSEVSHTRTYYPGTPLPIAILRRLFGEGIVWKNIKNNKL